jgi:hypothetical protein
MRLAITVVASLVVLNVLVILATATGTDYAWPLALGLAMASGLAALVVVGVWLLGRLTGRPSGSAATTAPLTHRVAAVAAATVAA